MNTPRAHAYIGCKIIQAEPEERDGKPGYRVYYPDSYVSWSPKHAFEEAYRRISPGEAQLVAFGSDDLVEAAVGAASDVSVADKCAHDFQKGRYDINIDSKRCLHCDLPESQFRRTQPPPGGP